MKGNCELICCQICKQEMSFGRIKRHISSQHKNITIEQYLLKHWSTLPLYKPCDVCKKNIVYKYKTCSKECRHQLEHNHKGKSKPKDFMNNEHKSKISKSKIGTIVSKETGDKISKSSKGVSRNKGKTPMLGKKQSEFQKLRVKERFDKYYSEGNEPWTKSHPHTVETIEKIFKHKPMNNLEKLVSSILDKNKIQYDFQFFIKTKNGICKSYDFKIKNSNILIEIDGDYWHGGPGVKKHFYKLDEVKTNDVIKNQLALESGFNLIRIWESNIYNQPNIIIQKIKELT